MTGNCRFVSARRPWSAKIQAPEPDAPMQLRLRRPLWLAASAILLVFAALAVTAYVLLARATETRRQLPFGTEVFSGEAACERLSAGLAGMKRAVPIKGQGSRACELYEGGTFNGISEYWTCECTSMDMCWELLEAWSGVPRDRFTDFERSEFSCVMAGPAFYASRARFDWWHVQNLKHAAAHQRIESDRRLWFFPVDLDHLVVYGCYESGGFPQARWAP